MNILVTGGRGQLGLSINKISGRYPRHRFIFTDIPECDITDKKVMSEMIERNTVDAIINCAAYTAVDKAESDEAAAGMINAEGVRILAELSAERGVKLVHISTDYVFDGTASEPLKEDEPTNPVSAYGRTKLAGEHEILKSGTDAAIIRTAWLYSEFGSNFVRTMLRLAGTRDEINVVSDQTGTPTYAPDLAEAVMKIIDNGIRGVEVYHFSDEGEISWYDFAVEIFRLAGKDVKVNPITTDQYPTPARRPAYSVLDKSKVKAAGVSVPDWKDSLKVCITELYK